MTRQDRETEDAWHRQFEEQCRQEEEQYLRENYPTLKVRVFCCACRGLVEPENILIEGGVKVNCSKCGRYLEIIFDD